MDNPLSIKQLLFKHPKMYRFLGKWIVLPLIHFLIWRYISRSNQRQRFDCDLNNNRQTIESGLSNLPARSDIAPTETGN